MGSRKRDLCIVHHKEIKLYGFKYNIICGNDFYRAFKKLDIIDQFATGFTEADPKKAAIEYLKHPCNGFVARVESADFNLMVLKPNVTPGTIAHECFHMTRLMMNHAGVVLSDDSEEAYAYALDYMVTQVTEAMVEIKEAIKIKNK